MDKHTMMAAVRGGLVAILQDNDFKSSLCEIVWEHLYPEGLVLSDEEDRVACKIFDECFDELLVKVKICLKVVI